MPRKVLILGGARFHGLQLVNFLNAKGDEVSVLNRGRYNNDYEKGIKHLVADRDDLQQLKEALKGSFYDAVIDNNAYNAAQIESILGIVRGCCGHYIFTSTAAAYLRFTSDAGLEEKEARIGEYGFYHPKVKDYALNKLAAEDAVIKNSGIVNFTILRFPNIFGEHDFRERLAYFYYRFKDGYKVLLEKGVNNFSVIYVKDVIKAFDAAIGNASCYSKIINVCDPIPYDYEKFFKTVYKGTYYFDKLFLADAYKLCSDGFYLPLAWGPALNTRLAGKLLGGISFTPLEDWCDSALEWEILRFGDFYKSAGYTDARKKELDLIKRYGRDDKKSYN